MNDLDARGRQAARRLHDAVVQADISLDRVPGGRRHGGPGVGWSLAAGALAVTVLLLGVVSFRRPDVVANLTEVSPVTTLPATIDTTPPPATEATIVIADPPPATTATVDTEPPVITITFPQPGHVSEEKAITFRGTTEPGARVTAGRYEAEVDADGSWWITLFLDEGSTTATFRATDAAGNVGEAGVTVDYQPPKTTTTETKKGFWAAQKFGSSTNTPPYDVFYGEGMPGSTVTVVSEYGGGSVPVGPDGWWEIKVFFETAPKNVAFPVKVKDSYTGTVQVFSFEALG